MPFPQKLHNLGISLDKNPKSAIKNETNSGK